MKRHSRTWFVLLSILLCANGASITRAQDNIWTGIGLEGAQITALAVDTLTPSTLYAGTYGNGVFKSRDGGRNWTAINYGMTNTAVVSLAIDPKDPTTLYALAAEFCDHDFLCKTALFKSVDAGESWSAIQGLTSISVSCLAIDPETPTTLYAGTSDCDEDGFYCSGTVFKSVDGGQHWNSADSGLPGGGIIALAIDPTSHPTLYAGSYIFDIFDGSLNILCKSVDGGRIWNQAILPPTGSGGIQTIVIAPTTPVTLYVATGGNLLKSDDRGESWSSVLATGVRAMAIDPTTPTIVYAGTVRGVLRSLDGGSTWNVINEGLTDNDPFIQVSGMTIASTTPMTVYAGTRKGVFALEPVLPFPPPLRRIIDASVRGKKLFVFGENFDSDAVILLNGEPQKTRKDGQGPTDNLIGTKAGKSIAPGQTVILQVRNSDGTLSPEFRFTRPID